MTVYPGSQHGVLGITVPREDRSKAHSFLISIAKMNSACQGKMVVVSDVHRAAPPIYS